ncbi:hypothetical protein SAMN06296273_1849 [Nitrosomonas ureae]|uniref:Rap1a immunity protein domain-containing protein n=1 Tax=Nitrosomonas ureae TaxID=44577 RepID=A0A285BYJ4_9PROT|nr:Rap1a/Tai family immunity protein [Nitrosomonas ureae]SNX60387.1 hypothetical protein SAMN06296273_1849 [Nitrosomonas ureae]
MQLLTVSPINFLGLLKSEGSFLKNIKISLLAPLVLTVLFFGSIANAADGEAAQHVEFCRAAISFSGPETPDSIVAMNIGFCFGLMEGVRGGNFFLKKSGSEVAFCEPSWFKNDDLAKAFVATVDKNPNLRELRGSLAALTALRFAFPCSK